MRYGIGARILVLCAAGSVAAAAAGAQARNDLTGHVLGPSGAPLRGVTVSIYTASPRTGPGTRCPSCYADCAKSAVSDAAGAFMMRAVDDSLVFRVLAVARGYAPRFADRVDPRIGPIIIRMTPRDSASLDPRRTSRGRVTGADGAPAVGALVELLGVNHGGWESYGELAGADPLAVCDQDGAWVLALPDTGEAPIVRVRARDHAPRFVADVPPPPATGRIALSRGATVQGVVMRDGRPVPGASVAIGGDGEMAIGGIEIRADSIAADARGRYRFQNLPCHHGYRLMVGIGSLPDGGATRHVSVTLGDADSVIEAPPLVIEPGRRLSGRVMARGGRTLPPGSKVTVMCGGASRTVPVGEDGRFEVLALPPEEVSVTVAVTGYRIVSLPSADIPRLGDLFTLGMTRDREIEIGVEPRPPIGIPPRPGR